MAVDAYVERGRAAFAAMIGRSPTTWPPAARPRQFVGLVAAVAAGRVGRARRRGGLHLGAVPVPARARARRTPRARSTGLLDAVTDEVDLVAVSAVQSADGRVARPAGARRGRRPARRPHPGRRHPGRRLAPARRTSSPTTSSAAATSGCSAPAAPASSPSAPTCATRSRPLAAGLVRRRARAGTPSTGRRCAWPTDARRFDLSPAWGCWVGHAPALDLLLEVGIDRIHAHDLALANAFRDGLGLPSGDSAIVSVPCPPDVPARLAAAGIRAAVRAGRLRLSFHLYNSDADVEAALRALG